MRNLNNIHLIITTAYLKNKPEILNEVKETYNSIKKYGDRFKTVSFLETVEDVNYDFIINSNYKYFFSKIGNYFDFKGTNWMNHMTNYLKNNYENDDIIVFLTGRYELINYNIFDLIDLYIINNNYDFLAKNDGDIYGGDGVHTFFISFLKKEFINFSDYYFNLKTKHSCIEIDLKKYMEKNKNCIILPKETFLGVRTNTSENKIKKNC